MNVNNKYALEVIKVAKRRLWDGSGEYSLQSKNLYCCLAVTKAAQLMTGRVYGDVKEIPEVQAIHARIKQEIGGESTMEDYLVNWCGWQLPLDSVLVQRSRQELLDMVAMKYFGGIQ